MNYHMSHVHDVLIVGGGPSGLNTARLLAREGLDVLLLEQKTHIGENVICTGIIGNDAFEEFKIPTSSVIQEIQNVKIVSPFETSLVYRHPQPFAYMVDRGLFDRNLADLFENNGGQIACRNQVVDIHVHEKFAEVLSDRGTKDPRKYRAQVVLIASGINQKINKRLGLGFARDYLHGAQAEMHVDGIDETTLFFGNSIAPGVFGWAVPIQNDRVKVGLLTKKDPKKYFSNLVKKLAPDMNTETMKNRVQYKAIVQGVQSRTFSDRIMVIGEAAGQVKTTTGGGVYYGMLCGRIAAEIIITKIKVGAWSVQDLAVYEQSWKSAILKELLIGYYARKLCMKLSDTQIEKLFVLAKNNGIFPYISKKGSFDWHSDLILGLAKKTPFFKSFF